MTAKRLSHRRAMSRRLVNHCTVIIPIGVTGDYFTALGIPLREGRLLTASDSHRAERVCVVDEDFARRYWPNGEALGQRVFQGNDDSTKTFHYRRRSRRGETDRIDGTPGPGCGLPALTFLGRRREHLCRDANQPTPGNIRRDRSENWCARPIPISRSMIFDQWIPVSRRALSGVARRPYSPEYLPA